MSDADAIIKAFDQCLDYTFGRALGRDNPNKSDRETAACWIAAGADLVICVMVFTKEMAWMHEKYLRSGHLRDRQFIPHSLKVFDENIAAAIRRAKGDGVDEWEKTDSLWRARIEGWRRNPETWRQEMWGPAPDQIGCRAPKQIMLE